MLNDILALTCIFGPVVFLILWGAIEAGKNIAEVREGKHDAE